jgi:catechol 2,3-dioxygenase-like lactoylglutathione lyase family enzyme
MSNISGSPSPLAASRTITKLPAQDLERARRFYSEQLGLDPVEEREGGLRYSCGETEFHVFQSSGSASGQSTQMGFEVDDLAHTMRDLRARSVVFETFEVGDLPMTDGVAVVNGNYPSKGTGELGAWFRDSEGNLIALGESNGSKAS